LKTMTMKTDSSTSVPPLHIADGRCGMTISGVSFRLEWNEMEKSLLKRSGRDLSTAVEIVNVN
jgi:hypothetical protein